MLRSALGCPLSVALGVRKEQIMILSETSQNRLAVLIDADNAQPSIAEGLLSEVAE